jgi:DNA primase
VGFPQAFIEAVRDAADIARVVSDYVPLKPAGARLKGLCPFHQEKTPSFHVDPEKGLFHCFGCRAGGDVFKFVMLYDKLGFAESVESLARRFGVKLPERGGATAHADSERDVVLRINEIASEYYRLMLEAEAGRAGRDYLLARGLTRETAERLGLGFAPDAWEALTSHLRAKRFSVEEVERAGLALPRKSGGGHYDRFRNRLIFPIRDVLGRTLAFGGRTIGGDEPKYINSPETPAYTKGDHLYGLESAREAIRREGFAVVVEGYLDLAALVQAGFGQVVASLGTAFTPRQSTLLARYTRRVWVSFDGDAAGAAATARTLDLLLDQGFEVRVVDLPAGQDPDDFVRSAGAAAYDHALREAPEYLEFLARREARTRDLRRIDDKVAALNALMPHLARLPGVVERSAWAGRVAELLGVEDDLVLQELRAAAREARTRLRRRDPEHPGAGELDARWCEARLVHLLLRSPDERRGCAASIEAGDLDGTAVEPIVSTLLRLARDGGAVTPTRVLEALESDELRSLFAGIVLRDEPEEGPNADDCLCGLRRERLGRAERDAVRTIGRLQSGEDSASPTPDELDRWLIHLQELARERDALH